MNSGPRGRIYDSAMNVELFESLLYQAESEVLDFKVDQYPFDKATDVEKSELLKDILSFANAWKRSDAYILIGVEENRGGRSIVRGISRQLLNRNLQQFVHSKTNKAMTFSYEELQVEGVNVAAITIPLQERPVYLRDDFGKLKKNVVYVRRGDSTGEAPPDEIVKMGQVGFVADAQPSLSLEFADLKSRQMIGTELDLQAIDFTVPKPESIPDYGRVGSGDYLLPVAMSGNNSDYFREIAQYLSDYGRFLPIGFAVVNSSTAAAINVVLRMRIPSAFVEVRSQDDMPDEVRIDIGTIQPGITEFSPEPIFIGSPESFDISLEAFLSGDNVSIPIVQTIRVKAHVEPRKISVGDLKTFARKSFREDENGQT